MVRRIEDKFRELKSREAKAFIPFIVAGDPDLETTIRIIPELERAGSHVIELGIPFSDPVADGPTIQLSSERALKSGTHLEGIFEIVSDLKDTIAPVVLFSYFNPIFHYGLKKFTEQAAKAGIKGALIVDLPPEEATDYLKLMKLAKLETVFLTSPATSPDRLRLIEDSFQSSILELFSYFQVLV